MALHPLDVLAAEATGRHQVPRSLRGYVDDPLLNGSLVDDPHERVVDVRWPTSIDTYQQMRRDSKLAAVLDGYKLQLRRAMWQLDGAGCRRDVVQLVADDLGLPVRGNDEPGPARTRGVSWSDHLRSALTMLDFGHAGHELQAAYDDDGMARLTGLWERPQWTITSIHVKPKTGEFNGITQELGPRQAFDAPQIRPDRMAWYAREPEGAGWYGVSLLRPSFAPWLFKKEMMRAAAVANRRFSSGIPTVEWAPSSTPTPQQFSEAQRAITAARVGDQSGVTMPPGAMMKLVGLSGGVPDTLAFIQWLDQQMSTSVLMQHLDLGQTPNGSRALGESFIDSWLLALEAIGEYVADVATRQIAARIVGWNWPGEPVPRVVVSGIGSRREVTAQSLQLLLSSGALAADPGLEDWVRREYRLPERTEPRPTPVVAPQRQSAPRGEVEAAVPSVAGASVPSLRTSGSGTRPGIGGPTASPPAYEQPELLDVAAFNPGWKDQPRRKDRGLRDHGGRWVDEAGGGAPASRPRTPRPSAPPNRPGTPASTRPPAGRPETAPTRRPLAESLAAGVTAERSLIDGPLGKVDLVTLGDGSRVVRKAFDDEEEAIREHLSALVATAVGAAAPRTHLVDNSTVVMDFMEGTPAVEIVGHALNAPAEWTDTDDGRLLGLADLLMDNQDRHNENWLINNGRIEGIDHGFSYQFQEAADEPPRPRSNFENHFIDDSRRPTWADNDLSPQDIATIRDRIVALRGDFTRVGAHDWHDWSLARLDAIGAHARGGRSRLS